MTDYFDVYSQSVKECENDEIPKIHLTAEDPPWDPSTNEYSERETQMLDHQGPISIPATATRGPGYVSIVISYSLAYHTADVMDNDNFVTAFSSQIQISIIMIGTAKNHQ